MFGSAVVSSAPHPGFPASWHCQSTKRPPTVFFHISTLSPSIQSLLFFKITYQRFHFYMIVLHESTAGIPAVWLQRWNSFRVFGALLCHDSSYRPGVSQPDLLLNETFWERKIYYHIQRRKAQPASCKSDTDKPMWVRLTCSSQSNL